MAKIIKNPSPKEFEAVADGVNKLVKKRGGFCFLVIDDEDGLHAGAMIHKQTAVEVSTALATMLQKCGISPTGLAMVGLLGSLNGNKK